MFHAWKTDLPHTFTYSTPQNTHVECSFVTTDLNDPILNDFPNAQYMGVVTRHLTDDVNYDWTKVPDTN